MEKKHTVGQQIMIIDPSQLVLDVDAFLNEAITISPHEPRFLAQEEQIFKHLGQVTTKQYPDVLMFSIDLQKICDQINDKYQDGFYFEEENDMVRFPYHRTIRRKSSLIYEPIAEKDLSPSQITSIRVGKHTIIGENNISLKRFNTSLLTTSPSSELEAKIR